MVLEIEFGGLFNSLAENKTPQGRAYRSSNVSVDRGILEITNRYSRIGIRPGFSSSDVCFGLGYGRFACNETQSFSVTGGTPTTGAATLSWNAHAATAIAWNATAEDFQTALSAIVDFEDGEITCFGGPWPSATIYATFKGRYAGANQALFVLDSETLNDNATVTIGTLVAGGPAEEYLVVIQPSGSGNCTLYSVTSSDGYVTTTWTSLATNLTASDWFFEQFADRVYAVNATDGILYKQLGGSWSGPASTTNLSPPTIKPTFLLVSTSTGFDDLPFGQIDFGSASYTNGGFASAPTIATHPTDNGLIKITLNATQPTAKVTITATLNTTHDWSNEDYFSNVIALTAVGDIYVDPNSINVEFINDDGSPVSILPDYYLFPGGDASDVSFRRHALFERKQRTDRDNVKKVKYTFSMSGTNGKIFYIGSTMYGTWLNDTRQSINVNVGPTRKAIEYAYSYFQPSTGLESKLSPITNTSVYPTEPGAGAWVKVGATGRTTLTNADKIFYYRRDRFGQWRRFAVASNDSTGAIVYATDKYMLDELDSSATLGTVTLPGGFLPTALGRFKQSLVVAADRKLWLSYVGIPLAFAPDPDNFAAQFQLDPEDPDIPRTVYMSANRSEDARVIVGQDALYASGETESYAMTGGDRPQELSPPRPLPGSRGCISKRGAGTWSGGDAVMSRDGLWYYAVSPGFSGIVATGTIIEQEFSKDIRTTWEEVFGDAPSNAVFARYREEIYCFAGYSYVKFTQNSQIEAGSLADSMLAALPTDRNGFIWATTKGELMRFGAGLVDDDGDSVTWEWQTGILDMPRKQLKSFQIEYTGSPQVVLDWWDGNAGTGAHTWDIALNDGTINYYPIELVQGVRFRIYVRGVGSDTVELLKLEFEDDAGKGKGN